MNDYRDVTPKPESSQSSQQVQEVLKYIFEYLKHPVQKIKSVPDWNWSTLIITLISISMISGVISGALPPSFFKIMGGLIISPLVAGVTAFLGSLFIYYYFQVFEQRTCSLKKIFTLILFANIPFFIFQVGSEIVPPITLVGFAFTSLLMAVGLTENFQMEKRQALRLVLILFAVVFVLWLWNRIEAGR